MARSKVKEVSKYFLNKGVIYNKRISNKKLNKLIYYAEVWSLVNFNKSIIDNVPIKAWAHGPVIPEIYHEYKRFGFGAINFEEGLDYDFGENEVALLDEIWKVYGKFDANYLSALTHQEKPWQKAREKYEFDSDDTITKESIINYYKIDK